MKAEIGRGNLVGRQGPGSLYTHTDGSSYIISSADKWYNRSIVNEYIRQDLLEIHDKRLEKILHVNKFLRVPEYRTSHDKEKLENVGLQIPINRFPLLEYCSHCGTFRTAKPEFSNKKRRCPACDKQRIFIQFPIVIMCQEGHISDFPHFRYAHTKQEHSGDSNQRIWLEKTGPSLLNWTIRCQCGAYHSLSGVTGRSGEAGESPYKNEMGGAKCFGKMPWTGSKEPHDCEHTPIAVLRNSLNVYQPDTVTALSISDSTDIQSNTTMEELYNQEFLRLNGSITEGDKNRLKVRNSFQTKGNSIIKSVSFIDRLQEIIVQTNFHRETPPDELQSYMSAQTGGIAQSMIFSPDYKERNWYPAKQVFGEGIFIEFQNNILERWENQLAVQKRYEKLKERVGEFYLLNRFDSASNILIHTVSHALIREFSKHSGYPMTAIRERLYLHEGNKGILLYVTDPDKAGTYGGLVRLASEEKFKHIFERAINNLEWCSSDPVCYELGEIPGQGIQHSNGSACHNCNFVPTTSCGSRNCFLDRDFVGRLGSTCEVTRYFDWFTPSQKEADTSGENQENIQEVKIVDEKKTVKIINWGSALKDDYSDWASAKSLIDENIKSSWPLADFFDGEVTIGGENYFSKFIWEKEKRIVLFNDQELPEGIFKIQGEWEICRNVEE